MTDPIADMLTRIRNASLVKKEEVVMPMSKLKYNLSKVLVREGWLDRAEVIKLEAKKNGSQVFDQLKLTLKYEKNGKPVISSIRRVSRPGLRIYAGKTELPKVLNNLGMAVISTPQGLLTNKEARKKGVGGEVICEIY
jgi:small subunit ribosomal protein S8